MVPARSIAFRLRLLTLLCLPAAGAHASFFSEYMIDPDDGMLDMSKYLSTVPGGFLPIPAIITEPAVGYGAAVAGVFFHETPEQKKMRVTHGGLVPENISILAGGGTDNGTWFGGGGHIGFWRNDTIRYKGFVGYPSANLEFYSVGSMDLPKPIELNIEGPGAIQELKFKVAGSHWFAGGRQIYHHADVELAHPFSTDDLTENQAAIIDYLNDQLNRTVTTSGLGPVVEYDSRNNPMNPEKGYNYRAEYLWFADGIGSDYDYETYRLTALNYWQLTDQFYFNLRLQYDGLSSDTKNLPAYIPPTINLRGISRTRYQGNSVAVIETEVSYIPKMSWYYLAFTGIGRTADSFSDLNDAENIDSYGVGFRYLIAKRYGMNMGIDVARGPEETAYYIQAGSTW